MQILEFHLTNSTGEAAGHLQSERRRGEAMASTVDCWGTASSCVACGWGPWHWRTEVSELGPWPWSCTWDTMASGFRCKAAAWLIRDEGRLGPVMGSAH